MLTLLSSLRTGLAPYDHDGVKEIEALAKNPGRNLIEKMKARKAAEVLKVYRTERLRVVRECHLLSAPIQFSFLSLPELSFWRRLEGEFPTGNIPTIMMLSSEGAVRVGGQEWQLLPGAIVKLTPQATYDLIKQGSAIICETSGPL